MPSDNEVDDGVVERTHSSLRSTFTETTTTQRATEKEKERSRAKEQARLEERARAEERSKALARLIPYTYSNVFQQTSIDEATHIVDLYESKQAAKGG